MQLKTILNRVQKFKSFVYGAIRWVEAGKVPALEVDVHPRVGSRGRCSGCGRQRAGYDRLSPRRFEFVPLWGLKVFLVYAPRRVACPDCGIKVERIPWAHGKCPLTETYAWFLASWAKRLSWKEVAAAFHMSWDSVFLAVEMAVAWGLAHRDLSAIESIGIDRLAAGPSVPDPGVSDRQSLQAVVVDWREADGENPAAVFPLVQPGTEPELAVHLLGHVEAVPQGDCQESQPGHTCAGPLPHHGAHEPGH